MRFVVPVLLDAEDDAAADRVRLDEMDGYLVADPKDPTGPPADQPLSLSGRAHNSRSAGSMIGTSRSAPFSTDVTNSPNSATPLM